MRWNVFGHELRLNAHTPDEIALDIFFKSRSVNDESDYNDDNGEKHTHTDKCIVCIK